MIKWILKVLFGYEKCTHDWEKIHMVRSDAYDYFLFKCNKCGKFKKIKI